MLNHDTSYCNVHGWIILDKPKELSSSKAVLTAKKILNVGLHEFLLRFIRDLYSVNSNLQNNYFFGKEK